MVQPAQEQLVLMLMIGTVAFLILIIFIILFFFFYQKKMLMVQNQKQEREQQFQQEMIQAQLESLERERTRMASDLHDSIGSLLWGIKVNLTYLNRTNFQEPEQVESFQDITNMVDESIHSIRRIAWELTPEAFQHTGLSESLSKMCEGLNGKGIAITFGETGHRLWNDQQALHVYRIVQELISNCLKHAKATTLSLTLNWSPATLDILVVDDGIGFTLNEEHAGVGLWNINHRVQQLKAEIKIETPNSGKGTSIALTIPL